MKKLISVVSGLICCLTAAFAQPAVIVGPITNSYNGHAYYLLSTSSWTDAEAAAQSLGGHLTTIRDQAEHDFVFDTFGNYGGVSHHLWIGLLRTNFSFFWVSGEPVTYTHWAPGEPNDCGGFGENRGIIFGPSYPIPGFWNDVSDSGFGGCGGGDLAPLGVVEIGAPIRLSIAVSAVDICWNSLPGHDYQLEYKTNVVGTNWMPAGSPISAVSSNTCATEHVDQPGHRIYRVKQLN